MKEKELGRAAPVDYHGRWTKSGCGAAIESLLPTSLSKALGIIKMYMALYPRKDSVLGQ